MAINNNSSTSWAGIFKEVYKSGDVVEIAKKVTLLSQKFKFSQKDAIGNKYHVPIRLSHEHSIVYAAAGTTPTWTAASYANGIIGDAQVDGAQIAARTAVDYEALMKSSNGDKASFVKATYEGVRSLSLSTAKRLEADILHGGRGWGTIESTSGSTLTITAETWAPNLWMLTKGMSLDAYANDGTTARTNSAADTISSVNLSTRTITLGNSVDASWVAGDFVFPESGSATNCMKGIDYVANNTGTLYNISGATYEVMQGNVIDTATGLPSMAKLLNGVAVLASKGAQGKMTAIMSPKAFSVLNSDQSALRAYPKAGGKGENGFEELVFHTGFGTLELMAHPYQKDGLIHLVQDDELSRIGAAELSFIRRGAGGEDVLSLEVSTAAASELRVYGSQSLFCEAPAHVGVLAGVTYS